MPICIGNATKLVQYILNENKQYHVIIKLGIKTDTADITGNILEEKNVQDFMLSHIETTIMSFIGKQTQIPPMYSAIKVNGKKLYQLARQGIEIERIPRQIEILNIQDIKYNIGDKTISFLIDCSKGTYIRSLCEDICTKLNTVGTVLELERTKTGMFTKEQSYTLLDIENHVQSNSLDKILYNIEDLFVNYKKINLIEQKKEYYINGVQLTQNYPDGIYAIYVNNVFIGLGEVKNSLLKRKFVI